MADPPSKSSKPASELPRSAEDDRTLTDSTFAKLPRAQRSRGAHPSFLPNSVLANRFKVVRFIARGGMGEVYEADDLELNERVAVKCIRFEYSQHENAAERFKREIQLARKVTNQNVCRTYDVFRHVEESDDGPTEILIVSMELLVGKTLSDWIFEKGKLTTEEALPIILQMAAGLGAAHAAGIVHRDFKSSNVLLVTAERNPGGTRAVITDFGLARGAEDLGARITGTLDVVGTPAYMAPEQLRSETVTPATDIYALGIVMFEMLTGKLPFAGGSTISMALKRLSEPAPSPKTIEPGLDENWEQTILRCLEREPADRFQTTEEVAKTLTGQLAVPPKRKERAGRASWQRWAVAAGLLLLLIAAIWVFYRKGNSASVTPEGKQLPPAIAAKSRPSIAILGFRNLSDSKEMGLIGEMLADGLWSQLDTEKIRFIAPSRVDEMKHNLGLTEISSSIEAKQLGKIRDYLGSDILVTGTYRGHSDSKGNQVDWNIHLLNTKDGSSLVSFPTISGTENEVNAMVAQAGKRIRDKLSIQLSPTEEERLYSSLSSNAEALKAFAEAREKRQSFDVQGAIRSLQNAVNADPDFAQARSALAEAWAELGYDGKAAAEAKKAFDLKAKLSPEAQGLVTGRYYEMTHDWPKAIENYASLRTLYLDDPEYALLLAKAQTGAGNGQAALATLEQAGKLNVTKGVAAQIDLAKSKAQESVGNYHEQLASASAATDVAQSMGSDLLAARGRIEQCAALLNLGEADKARPLCEEAKRLNLQAGDHLGAAKATNVVANVAYQQGSLDVAKQMYTQALGIAQTIGDKLDEAGALNNIANILRSQGNLEESEKTYRKSIEVAQERGDKPDAALAMQNLAIVLYEAGDSRAGRKMFLDSAGISRDIGDKSTEAMALDNLCIISLEAAELKQAKLHCADALKLRKEIDSKPDKAKSLVSRGDIEMAEGNVKEAKSDYEEALKIQESGGQKGDAAYTRIALSRLALQDKRFEDAKRYAEDAAAELATEKDSDGEAEARSAAALAKLALKDNGGATKDIEAALKLTERSGGRLVKLEVAMARAKLDLAEGRTEEAIRSLEKIEKEGRASGLVALGMESTLTLGAAQLQAGNSARGKAILSRLSSEAKSKGFVLVAERAQMEAQNAHRE